MAADSADPAKRTGCTPTQGSLFAVHQDIYTAAA
jgi:hypothetical protein